MKKNDWILLISVFTYSLLFYEQYAGINFFIFNLVVVGLLIFRDKNILQNKIWISVAAGAVISSFFIFMYGSPLAIWANTFSLLILSALSINARTSFLTSIFLTFSSITSSIVYMFFDWSKRKRNSAISEGDYKRPFYVKFFLILIPFIIAIIFFLFYQQSNPLFYNFTKNINFDFISISWMFFTVGGLLLMYGFFYNYAMPDLYTLDVNKPMILTPEIASRKTFFSKWMRNDTENISGIILFALLNSLLLIVNTLDINYFLFNRRLPAGVDYKAFVHDGIGTLITSIITAIIIILFYFRGESNFYEKNRWIKRMAFTWIVQNAFMIFSTAYRNCIYINESGLSYKKIGVYIYLLLALIGLITTFVKVWKVKTNWYLFRINASVYYYFLVLGCVPNWDVIITNFNVKKYTVERKKLEKYLLLDLSYKNLPQLLSLPDTVARVDDARALEYYNYSRGTHYHDFKSGLAEKLYDFMADYSKLEWQSACYEKYRVFRQIESMKDNILSLDFLNTYLVDLKPIDMFNNLREISLKDTEGFDLRKLAAFPKLQKLELIECQSDNLNTLPEFKTLQYLSLSGNNIQDISALGKFNSLEIIDLSGCNRIKSYHPLLRIKHLKVLKLKRLTKEELEYMKYILPDVKIETYVKQINSEQ